jgi:toxin-antitoxin system PIN domain toxin
VILPDVNVLVAAFRQDAPAHERTRAWMDRQVGSPAAFGMADRVLEGFMRIVTHPRVFRTPNDPTSAIDFVNVLTSQPNCVRVAPGDRQWNLFLNLVKETGASGNEVADAWLAALAIESGSEWVTWDRGFSRFPDLRWREPG